MNMRKLSAIAEFLHTTTELTLDGNSLNEIRMTVTIAHSLYDINEYILKED